MKTAAALRNRGVSGLMRGWQRELGHRREPVRELALERTLAGPDVDLPRPCDLLLVVVEHFLPLGEPPRGARNGEQHGEEVRREGHRSIDQARIEVDVRIELAGDE